MLSGRVVEILRGARVGSSLLQTGGMLVIRRRWRGVGVMVVREYLLVPRSTTGSLGGLLVGQGRYRESSVRHDGESSFVVVCACVFVSGITLP